MKNRKSILIGAAVLLLAGCKSVEENIERRSAEILSRQNEYTTDPCDLPEVRLDWETAVSMLDSNLVMRDAGEEIVKAEVAVNRVFLDLIPQLTIQGIYSQAITQFTELSSDNFNANINALFNVPGVVRLRMDYYAAMLACLGAQKQYELALREETVNLYLLFRTARHNQALLVAEALQAADPALDRVERHEMEFRRKQRESDLWLALSAAVGDFSSYWNVDPSHLPDFDYLTLPPDWKAPEEVGKLFVTLEAIELEAARLRELGIKFQYWPQLNMRLYSPSVYLLSGGDRGGFEFDADDIRFEASVRMKLDTNLQFRDQLREARRTTELLRQKLHEDAFDRARKLSDARDALVVADVRIKRLLAQKKMLNTMPSSSAYDVFEQNLQERIELINQLIATEQELDGAITLLWMADESKWWVPEVGQLPDP